MDALVEYGDAIRRNIDRVQAVRVDQLAGPTPCRDWDVTALLTHLIGCPSTIHQSHLQDQAVDPRQHRQFDLEPPARYPPCGVTIKAQALWIEPFDGR